MQNDYISSIKQEEIDFPKLFASYVEKEYGILFYMEDNKDSYDGNHACIYPDKIADLDVVLKDITSFYEGLGMKTSIYHPFVKGYFKNNEAILNANGYTYYCKAHNHPMCWQWAGPSEHICYRAGFREAFTMEAWFTSNR